jgi:hypothetical protein
VHLGVALDPGHAVGDGDLLLDAVQREVRVEAEQDALVGEVAVDDGRVVHGAHEEAAARVHGAIVAAHPLLSRLADARLAATVLLPLLVGPEFLDPSCLAGLAGEDSVAIFATEDELVVVAFDIRSDADGEVELVFFQGLFALGEIDEEQLLFDDVHEAECVCVLFPERPLAQAARGVEPGLGDGVFLDFVGHCLSLLAAADPGESCGCLELRENYVMERGVRMTTCIDEKRRFSAIRHLARA